MLFCRWVVVVVDGACFALERRAVWLLPLIPRKINFAPLRTSLRDKLNVLAHMDSAIHAIDLLGDTLARNFDLPEAQVIFDLMVVATLCPISCRKSARLLCFSVMEIVLHELADKGNIIGIAFLDQTLLALSPR